MGTVSGLVSTAMNVNSSGKKDVLSLDVKEALFVAVKAVLDGSVHDALTNAVKSALADAVKTSVTDAVKQSVQEAVQEVLGIHVKKALKDALLEAVTVEDEHIDGGEGTEGGQDQDKDASAVESLDTDTVKVALRNAIWRSLEFALAGTVEEVVLQLVDG